ncbi:tyrosine-type recombinase/integrase [Ilumatobacter sp.]|uniref:tyrosine-type recombinase/integrase n=1 Tax=Ilumatobacter sp. TaxID=1967498 RepID=UPI003B529595
MGQRRTFGSVRKHRSGRWGADYTDPVTGQRVTPGRSFASKVEATRWLSEMQTDLDRGQALDATGTKRTFESYANTWLAGRTDLRPKTLDLYRYLLDAFILPRLGDVPVGKIDPSTIRRWHGRVSEGDQSVVTTAKAYRLLRQILSAAVDDLLLRANPCTLKGVAVERTQERQTPSIAEAMRLVDAVKPEYRLMAMLAAVVGLRRGECFGLRRRHLVEADGVWTVTVESAVVFVRNVPHLQPPKTSAGIRRLVVPAVVTPTIVDHLDSFGPFGDDDLLIVDRRTGQTPTLTVWRRVWENARKSVGVDYTFHDLRHLAGTLNATAGASIRESMARMGHSSPRAALRYQHLVDLRDAEVASSIDRLFD